VVEDARGATPLLLVVPVDPGIAAEGDVGIDVDVGLPGVVCVVCAAAGNASIRASKAANAPPEPNTRIHMMFPFWTVGQSNNNE